MRILQARILASALFNNDMDVGLQEGHQNQFPEVCLKKEINLQSVNDESWRKRSFYSQWMMRAEERDHSTVSEWWELKKEINLQSVNDESWRMDYETVHVIALCTYSVTSSAFIHRTSLSPAGNKTRINNALRASFIFKHTKQIKCFK